MQKRLLAPAVAVGLAALTLPTSFAGAQDRSGPDIELSPLGTYENGTFGEAAAEIVAHDPGSDRLLVVNAEAGVVDVLDAADPAAPVKLLEFDAAAAVGADGAQVNSVAVHDGLAAAAVEAPDKTDPGWVAFFTVDGEAISSARVGAQPDSIAFTPDGAHVVTADEGEPADDYSADPPGTVSIVAVATGEIRTADFTAWDADSLPDQVRLFGPEQTLADADAVPVGIEPEYVTIADDATAYVTLQENNAIAEVDIASAEITALLPLGTKDHRAETDRFDASDKDDEINLATWPVEGMYLPDTVASYTAGDQTYLVTANEGDSRDWDAYSEEARVEDLELCENADAFAGYDLADLTDPAGLGRLKVTTAAGRTDSGCFERLYSFGGRSFSIWSTDGDLVFDSGSEFEQIVARTEADHFNTDHEENDFDSRSDAKGPEPEAVTVGRIDERTYAFIGLERQSGIMVYDVTDPAEASFVDYVTARDFTSGGEQGEGDLGPESIVFIAAADSTTGRPMLAVGNEVSGTTTLWDIDGDTGGAAGPTGDADGTEPDALPATGSTATGTLVGAAAALVAAGAVLFTVRNRRSRADA